MKRLAVLLIVLCACRDSEQNDAPSNRPGRAGPIPADRFDAPAVETAADAWKRVPEWLFSEKPLFVIGDTLDATNATFWEARDATLLSDGRIVMPTNNTEQHYFSADGKPITKVGGRAGEGPGEFLEASVIARIAGDTTVTFDIRNSRASFFAPDGKYKRMVTIPRGRSRGLFGALDNGHIIKTVLASGPGMHRDGTGRDTLLVLGFDQNGVAADTFGLLEDHMMTCVAAKGSCSTRATPPSLAARGRRVYYTDGDLDEIRVYE